MVPEAAPRLGHVHAELMQVTADMDGVQHGVGFVLYILDGCLRQLEGSTYDEPWPASVRAFRLTVGVGVRAVAMLETAIKQDGWTRLDTP